MSRAGARLKWKKYEREDGEIGLKSDACYVTRDSLPKRMKTMIYRTMVRSVE